MEIITIFGVRWRIAPLWELLLTLFIIFIIIAFFALLKYYNHLKFKRTSLEQLFIYKARKKGLTGYQIRILQHIVSLLKLKKPEEIFTNKELFETGLTKFLQYLIKSKEIDEDIFHIFKDLVITYETIYNHIEYQEPLTSIESVTPDILICGYSQSNRTFLAKIIQINENSIFCKYYRKHQMSDEIIAEPVTIFFFRSGDAEYTFETKILSVHENILELKKPETIKRIKPVHHPFIHTFIPCNIKQKEEVEEENIPKEVETIKGTIERFNEYEAIVRVDTPLQYDENYILLFSIENFKIEVLCKILSEHIEKEKIYYTFKFIDMSTASRNVISNYIKEAI